MSKLTGKTKQDLIKLLGEKQEGLRDFRFGIAGSKVRNVREGRSIRREIAQIKTALKTLSV